MTMADLMKVFREAQAQALRDGASGFMELIGTKAVVSALRNDLAQSAFGSDEFCSRHDLVAAFNEILGSADGSEG